MSELRERQEQRELDQMSNGINRYHAKVGAQGMGETKSGLPLVFVAMKAMIPWIREKVEMLESGATHPSSIPLGIHWLAEMQPDAVAYLAAKICVTAAYHEAKATRTAMKIANLIEENYRYEQLEQAEPHLANSMSQKAKRWSRASTRRKIMRKAADVAGVRRMGWTEKEKLKLGLKLIECYVTESGFAELKATADGAKGGVMQQKIITMTDSARREIAKGDAKWEGEDPENKPMIHPPKPWTSPISGGYLTHRMKQPILRGASFRKVTEGLLDELYSTDLSQVYDAVNAVQDTAWRVNRPLFEVLSVAIDRDQDMGVLPERDKLPLPPVPAGLPDYGKMAVEDMTEEQQAKLKRWKAEAREVHSLNAANTSKIIALDTKKEQAKDVVNEVAIYFPHSLDFRGRLYPMSAELSPQSDDISKALLEFAEGKPLGESGGYWLCVHLANLYGNDKWSFDDRVAWAQENHDHLLRSAQRPLDYTWWTDAEEPWCFLAACMEYAAWQTQGDGYESHLPIAMDGSCSGIQHFSALLRDQRGAEAVNLTPKPLPADIYNEVLAEVKRDLNDSKEPLAKVWHDKVDRKIVKRPCMTFAYSVTSAGIKQQIIDEIRKRQGGDYLPGTTNWQAAHFLAPIVEAAIRRVVDRAAEAMDWLKAVSKHVSKQDIPTGWTTPLGFRVLQPYLKTKGERIKVLFQGQPLFLTLTFEGTKIDGPKQTSAVAPNFVHSMDATHLMMTVNRLKDEGITDSFAVIHDSFGVHACDVDELHYALRDEFINLYSDNEVLVEFYQESLLRLPSDKWADVEPAPEAGDYDIEEVRDADFFFA
jgi:DNA-directed RNA polymerase